ncbi:type II toxin-antitoxin system PemK/MazF family toxin [Pararhizobium sp. O133]|uniref:type II toxin-antitoxin system PemK/MazF family toxin n=1 Tax=Pararhizobium sp. O133 TaxID=3449278 RepID=UPI003F6841A9
MTTIKRGAVYVSAERGSYTNKPRPVVVIQNTNIQLDSVIVVPLTTFDSDGYPIRVEIAPTRENGLQKRSFAMCDKIAAVPRKNLGSQVGTLTVDQLTGITSVLGYLLGDERAVDKTD